MQKSLKVIISGLSIHTRVGMSAEERAYPQRVVIDLQVSCAAQQAPSAALRVEDGVRGPEPVSGDLSKTISYSVLKSEVEQLIKSNEWFLLEDMGEAISSLILQSHSMAQEVSVLIKKFVVQGTEWTGVSITLSRD